MLLLVAVAAAFGVEATVVVAGAFGRVIGWVLGFLYEVVIQTD